MSTSPFHGHPVKADVRPFRGLRFDPALSGDIGVVISPPYDVIDPALQEQLHRRSPNNVVRVEYGLVQPGDDDSKNKYTRAGTMFREWLAKGVLRRDAVPSMYLHHHYFTHQGTPKTRRSLFAAVRLEEWDKGAVRRHEGTAAVFKVDRLNLMRATHANVSPVLSMYRDAKGAVASVMATVEAGAPLFNATSGDGESHTLWAITDPRLLRRLAGVFSGQSLYIADGHHRYETGLAYRNERRAASPDDGPDAAYNFVMMSLIEFSDPGVVVLPTHRMVRLPETPHQGLREKLARYFDIETVPVAAPSANMLGCVLKPADRGTVVLGAVGVETGALLVLRLRDTKAIAGLMPADRSEAYRALDVSVLHHVVLEHMLGVSEGERIAYTRSELEAWERVASGEFQLGFLLGQVDTLAIKGVADAADKMPQKSTYFYPKAPTGLVLNPLDGLL